MGSALRHAQEIIAALEAQEWGRVRQLVASDFIFLNPYSPTPQLSADEWLVINQILTNAFSDFTYNFEILDEKGPQVWVADEFEGTHDSELDLSLFGMGVIPATGKHVRAERSIIVGTVNPNGGLGSIEVIEEPDGSGLVGLLAKIGVTVSRI